MKTIIQGKNIVTTYSVDRKTKTIENDKGEMEVFADKPELVKKTKISSWETIAECDEKLDYNSKVKSFYSLNFGTYINLSETEEVLILESITRVDLNAYVLHVDKILSEKEIERYSAEDFYENNIHQFDKAMIESDEKLLAYCKLHKLDPFHTDVDELFKVVYPNKTYSIVDGKLIVDNAIVTGGLYVSSAPYTINNDIKISY